MKKLNNIILSAAFLIIGIACLTLVRRAGAIENGYIQISQAFLDSLGVVANIKPDTVVLHDTIYIGDLVTEHHPVPKPVDQVDTTIHSYNDSIVNDQVHAWVNLLVKGEVLDIDWKYQPIYRDIATIVTVTKPYPVSYEKKVILPSTGFYGSVGAGLGGNKAIISGEVMYLDGKDHIYGGEIGRFQKTNYIKLEYGIKF